MDVSEQEFAAAQARMSAQRKAGYVTQAFYDPEADRVVVALSTGIDLAFAPRLAEGLAGASAEDLAAIEVSPSGLGLHWPRLARTVVRAGGLGDRWDDHNRAPHNWLAVSRLHEADIGDWEHQSSP